MAMQEEQTPFEQLECFLDAIACALETTIQWMVGHGEGRFYDETGWVNDPENHERWFAKHMLGVVFHEGARILTTLYALVLVEPTSAEEWLAEVLAATDLCHAYGSIADHMPEPEGGWFDDIRQKGLDNTFPDLLTALGEHFEYAVRRLARVLYTPSALVNIPNTEQAREAIINGIRSAMDQAIGGTMATARDVIPNALLPVMEGIT